MKLLGLLIILLVSISASYAADTTDSNSNDVSNQVLTDPGLSDDSGLSDSNTDDESNDSVTDDNNDASNDNADPTIYYSMGSNSSNGSGVGYASGHSDNGTSTITSTISVSSLKDPKIPMQKTGIPILPAELGIISIIGGFMINRIRS